MSLREIAQAVKDLADRSQNGALRPDEYTGGTFGISNLGHVRCKHIRGDNPAAADCDSRGRHGPQSVLSSAMTISSFARL